MIVHDPSESVRSSDIIWVFNNYFKTEYEIKVGGTILHLLYPQLNHSLFSSDNLETKTLLNTIIYIEDLLIKNKIIPSDFMFVIGRNK